LWLSAEQGKTEMGCAGDGLTGGWIWWDGQRADEWAPSEFGK